MTVFKTLPLSALILTALLVVVGANAAADLPTPPVVSNVQVTVRDHHYVDVTYDLEQAEGKLCIIWAKFSKDGGATYPYWISTVSGDIRTVVQPGSNKQFTWNAYADYPGEHIIDAGIRVEAQTQEYSLLLPGGVPLDLIRILPGKFMMGSYPGEQDSSNREEPQHQVTFNQLFSIGKYEVTQQQWLAVMGGWPSTPPSVNYGIGDAYPIYYVSWNDVKVFISVLNAHIVASGQGDANIRLPSEAEWEYACRANTTTRFYWGDDPSYSLINSYAWNPSNNTTNGAKPVGTKIPNAWGIYDMPGNVLEWCEDDWHTSYINAPSDGRAWVESPRNNYPVLRGGSWFDSQIYCRSAYRAHDYPSNRYQNFGFRIARSAY